MVSRAYALAAEIAARGSRGVVSAPATLASTTILLLPPGSLLPLPIRNRVM
jgi:hypothetical protein